MIIMKRGTNREKKNADKKSRYKFVMLFKNIKLSLNEANNKRSFVS